MTALDEFKGRVWREAQEYLYEGSAYADGVREVLAELGVTEPPEDEDAEVKEFKVRLWQATAKKANDLGWCEEWEDAMTDLGVQEPPAEPVQEDPLPGLKWQINAAMERLERLTRRG